MFIDIHHQFHCQYHPSLSSLKITTSIGIHDLLLKPEVEPFHFSGVAKLPGNPLYLAKYPLKTDTVRVTIVHFKIWYCGRRYETKK